MRKSTTSMIDDDSVTVSSGTPLQTVAPKDLDEVPVPKVLPINQRGIDLAEKVTGVHLFEIRHSLRQRETRDILSPRRENAVTKSFASICPS